MAQKRILNALFVAIFLDLLGFGMIIADFQIHAESVLPKSIHTGWVKGLIIGSILASTFIIQSIASPRWGRLSDHSGRRTVLLICSLLSALSMFIYGLANSVEFLVLSRIIGGVGAANVAIAHALVADLFDGPERKAAMARTGASVSAGLIAGPAIGGHLSERFGSQSLGIVAGLASTLGLLILFFAVPCSQPKVSPTAEEKARGSFALLREFPELRKLVVIAVIAWFALACLEGTFARLIKSLYGYGTAEFGNLFAFESALTICIQAFALAWLMKAWGEGRLLRFSYLTQGIGLAMIPFAGAFHWTPIYWLFVSSLLYGVGASIATPTINALCSHLAPAERQGELFGLIQSTRAIGFIVGPVLGGVLFGLAPSAPYVFAGVVCLVAMALVVSPKPEAAPVPQ